MGHRHTREDLLAAVLDVARADGLSRLTFGRVARAAGTSDRVVVYYFPSTGDLVTAVLVAVGEQLQQVLGRAFDTPAPDHATLMRTAWPVVADPAAEPVFRLLFEAIGLAVAGREPFAALASQLFRSWVNWLSGFVDGDPAHRRAEAEAALGLLDGLLLLRLLAGPDAAQRAAVRLGVA